MTNQDVSSSVAYKKERRERRLGVLDNQKALSPAYVFPAPWAGRSVCCWRCLSNRATSVFPRGPEQVTGKVLVLGRGEVSLWLRAPLRAESGPRLVETSAVRADRSWRVDFRRREPPGLYPASEARNSPTYS
ncbi:hypothetical protein NDU88_001423 [Pleurodeles waltl]|uniref:Uncharacterized protein n=1 Tax=Pleurodeles waltl TaxID=8319 RepID=A0AAV7VZF6_PLEWA|nr:hypothetical protein NDU88_001423 [Pleurodeles waltl]